MSEKVVIEVNWKIICGLFPRFWLCSWFMLSDTTRTKRIGEEDGNSFFFITQEQMLKDIANNKFVEYGQHDGFYYGTKYDSIRDCIRDGRMCILDVSPQVSCNIIHWWIDKLFS